MKMESHRRGAMLLRRTGIYNKKGDVLKRGRESIQNECTLDFE